MMFTVHTAYEGVRHLVRTCAVLVLRRLRLDPCTAHQTGSTQRLWLDCHLLLFPLGGAILYGLFGIIGVRTRARRLRGDPANETKRRAAGRTGHPRIT